MLRLVGAKRSAYAAEAKKPTNTGRLAALCTDNLTLEKDVLLVRPKRSDRHGQLFVMLDVTSNTS